MVKSIDKKYHGCLIKWIEGVLVSCFCFCSEEQPTMVDVVPFGNLAFHFEQRESRYDRAFY